KDFRIGFFKRLVVPLGRPEETPALAQRPVRHSLPVVIPRNAVEDLPVMEKDLVGIEERIAGMIDMVGLRSAAIEFENGKVLSLFQLFYRSAFDIVTSIIEGSTVADGVKNTEEVFIDQVPEVGELCAPVQVSRIGQHIALALGDHAVEVLA